VACRGAGQACSASSAGQACCAGLRCSSTTRKCVACKVKGASCTASSQCCTGLTCNRSTRKCR
jgi:hypothetical protein